MTTPYLGEGVSGVILCDETLRQGAGDGRTFPEVLASRGLLPGIKVDTGVKPLAGTSGEKVTEGLDGLRERLAEYACLGARFAKWRAVFAIGDGSPSWQALRANAHALARYACLCHEAGLVPVVEPEVLMDGAHSMERCAAVTAAVLFSVFAELQDYEVALDAIVLKPNMVVPGDAVARDLGAPEEVAARTVGAFSGIVPGDVAGIAFLSGGQCPEVATANLAALQHVRGAVAADVLLRAGARRSRARRLARRPGAGQRRAAGARQPGGLQPRRAPRRLPPRGRGQLRARVAGRRHDSGDRTGTVAVTVVPRPGREVTVRRPPTSSARSVMLRRP